MKLRLFTLYNTLTGKTNGEYYSSKAEARVARDKINPPGTLLWVTWAGPDHWRYKE